MIRVCVIAVLTPTLFTQAAIAQSVDRPNVKVGDQWKFAIYYTVPSTTPNRA